MKKIYEGGDGATAAAGLGDGSNVCIECIGQSGNFVRRIRT